MFCENITKLRYYKLTIKKKESKEKYMIQEILRGNDH